MCEKRIGRVTTQDNAIFNNSIVDGSAKACGHTFMILYIESHWEYDNKVLQPI